MDACVVIDFITVDESLFTLTSRHVGDVYLASPVLAEVRRIDITKAESLGIRVVHPPLEMIMDAASRGGRLSMQDHLCIMIAKANAWTCVSNDRRLRDGCVAESVPVMWGLQVLIRLVEAGALSVATARELGMQMAASNPRLGARVMARFLERIDGAD